RRAAESELGRGLARCESGDVRGGLLTLVRALFFAEAAQAHELARRGRAQVGAWAREIHPLRAAFRVAGPGRLLAFSPGGRRLLAVGDRGAVLIGVPSGRAVALPGAATRVTDAAFSPDGRRLALVDGGPAISLYRLEGEHILGPDRLP